ncbi:MAG TPA: PilZ domain-containing protein [Thermoanaerobaculia bacterium]|nr:PilZ domain-containing protein [Thermoanaerobaculia bacterium]
MSALEQTPYPISTPVAERRTAPRLRVTESLPVFVGRGVGTLVDLSATGARVRHAVQAQRGSNVRLTFEWHGERFGATAEVLSSRVVSLGNGESPTIYESRLRFRLLTDAARDLLDRVLVAIENEDVRRWVANLRGWNAGESASPARIPIKGSYLRCRLLGRRWERKWTQDASQPNDGFVLPETTGPRDVDELCATYENADDDGRNLIRLIAAASLV